MKIDVLKKNQYQNSIWLKMLLQKKPKSNCKQIGCSRRIELKKRWKSILSHYPNTNICMYIYVQNDDFKTIKSDSNKVNFLNVSYPKTNVIWYKHPRWDWSVCASAHVRDAVWCGLLRCVDYGTSRKLLLSFRSWASSSFSVISAFGSCFLCEGVCERMRVCVCVCLCASVGQNEKKTK